MSKKTEFYQSFWRFCFQLGRSTHKYHDKSGNAQLGKPQFFWTLCRKANDHSYLSYSCNISTLPILGNIYPYQGHDFRQQRCFIRAQTRPQIRRHVERSGKGWTAELRRDSLRVLLPRGLVKNQGKRYTAELLGLWGGTYIIQYGEDKFWKSDYFLKIISNLINFNLQNLSVETRYTSVLHISYSAQ